MQAKITYGDFVEAFDLRSSIEKKYEGMGSTLVKLGSGSNIVSSEDKSKFNEAERIINAYAFAPSQL
jgi:hypothetical protein